MNEAVATNGSATTLEGVTKRFGDFVAVDHIDLEIKQGEFFSLLGPSGSGKTTCLRMIAGFEEPSEGRVLIQGRDATTDPPYDRPVNTVFQDYALFPHMTVLENVEYGLRVKKTPKAERRERAHDALQMVRLVELDDRKPSELSGGQRQRVALARALVNRPLILLLDEPLGALDLKLRQQMQIELKQIQQTVGITFIYVTHDQEEALTMSDRLAVMNHGRIEQIDTPANVYERPTTGFVADFVGVSNTLIGEAARRVAGSADPVSVRPEKIHMSLAMTEPIPDGHIVLAGRVNEVVYLGSVTRYLVEVEGGTTVVVTQQNLQTSSMDALEIRGQEVRLTFDKRHLLKVQEAQEVEEGKERV